MRILLTHMHTSRLSDGIVDHEGCPHLMAGVSPTLARMRPRLAAAGRTCPRPGIPLLDHRRAAESCRANSSSSFKRSGEALRLPAGSHSGQVCPLVLPLLSPIRWEIRCGLRKPEIRMSYKIKLFNQTYFESGFRTPGATARSGLRFEF